jgi:hypothetical protein
VVFRSVNEEPVFAKAPAAPEKPSDQPSPQKTQRAVTAEQVKIAREAGPQIARDLEKAKARLAELRKKHQSGGC